MGKWADFSWLDRTVGKHWCEFWDIVTGLVHQSKNFTFSHCLQYQLFIVVSDAMKHTRWWFEYKNILSKCALMDLNGPCWSWRQVYGMNSSKMGCMRYKSFWSSGWSYHLCNRVERSTKHIALPTGPVPRLAPGQCEDCVVLSPQSSTRRDGRSCRARRRSWRGASRRRGSSSAGSSSRRCRPWSSGCSRSTKPRRRACRSSTGCSWNKPNCSIRIRSVSTCCLWRVVHSSTDWVQVMKYIEHSNMKTLVMSYEWENVILNIFTALSSC